MSVPIETGVLLTVYIPTSFCRGGADTPIEFGAATVNPKSCVSAGTFLRTDERGEKVHLVKVSQAHSPDQVAFCGVNELAALELVKLLRYVLEGRISRATYMSELPLWTAFHEQPNE